MRLNSHPSGRHFLQIPGPTNVPDRVLRAMDHPTIDHRGPEFNALAKKVLRSVRQVFQTKQPVIIYPASGTGAGEAALVNTLSPGDQVLMWKPATSPLLWKKMADKLGIKSEFMGGDWRQPADPAAIEKRLKEDTAHAIKAVCIVHNETSTGVVSDISRRPARHRCRPAPCPAAGRHDLFAGLGRLPPRRLGRRRHGRGLAEGPDAAARPLLQCGEREGGRGLQGLKMIKAFWGWDEMLAANANGWFPYIAGDQPALWPQRSLRHAAGGRARRRVRPPHSPCRGDARRRQRLGAGDPVQRSQVPYSGSLTAIVVPEGHDADAFRKVALENFNLSLGQGLTKVAGKVFRIGHLGDFNDLMLMGALSGVEMALGRSLRCRTRRAALRRPSPICATRRREHRAERPSAHLGRDHHKVA